jgi:Protein of unknown function (DUF2865)
MVRTVPFRSLRGLAPAVLALTAVTVNATAQQASFPGGPARNPACVRLEAQLASFDRGSYEPGKADQIKRLEDTANRQQADLDRVSAQGRRMGCEGRGFFSLFGGQPQQCGPINNQIQQLRAVLDRTLADLQRLQGNSSDREGQRRTILAALAQADCGPQYREYANRGGNFFESLFGGGPGSILSNQDPSPGGNTYRTLCVRTCDGYYFPISYSTVPGKFAEDERICQAMCPASEVVLYAHRNPGEDITQATSIGGRSYSELPNAFAYRKAFNPSCGCKAAGQTWADALKHLEDSTVERGDILVNEERAKQLSQPQTDAQGKPIRASAPATRTSAPTSKGPNAPAAAPEPAQSSTTGTSEEKTDGEPAKRQVRTVGPTFLPVR